MAAPRSEPAARAIPDPGFAGDVGGVDERVASALAAYRPGDRISHRETLALLQATRLLVPVVAVLGEVEVDEHGRAHDKTSDMATVMLTGADGRQGLLAFTGMAALSAWRADGRPVPVTCSDAAAAALSEGADALLIDLSGPHPFVIEGDDLASLAAGHLLVRLDDGRWAWAAPTG